MDSGCYGIESFEPNSNGHRRGVDTSPVREQGQPAPQQSLEGPGVAFSKNQTTLEIEDWPVAEASSIPSRQRQVSLGGFESVLWSKMSESRRLPKRVASALRSRTEPPTSLVQSDGTNEAPNMQDNSVCLLVATDQMNATIGKHYTLRALHHANSSRVRTFNISYE